MKGLFQVQGMNAAGHRFDPDEIIYISEVIGRHGEAQDEKLGNDFRGLSGPYVRVTLRGGFSFICENCSREYDGNMSTTDWIMSKRTK
jgi:hypothetical protein